MVRQKSKPVADDSGGIIAASASWIDIGAELVLSEKKAVGSPGTHYDRHAAGDKASEYIVYICNQYTIQCCTPADDFCAIICHRMYSVFAAWVRFIKWGRQCGPQESMLPVEYMSL